MSIVFLPPLAGILPLHGNWIHVTEVDSVLFFLVLSFLILLKRSIVCMYVRAY